MSTDARLSVHVSGPLACFTRPEYAAERVSYPVITPTAAVGLLSAIFWKPEMRWVVREIWVLNPIAWFSMTRNEVADRASSRVDHLDPNERRVQRHTLSLRDVAYVIHAEIDLRPHASDPAAKYRDQFRRRVERGACFSRPYLGLQEFHADFRPVRPTDRPDPSITMPLGSIPLDLQFQPRSSPKDPERIDPVFWAATIDQGVLAVPLVAEVLRAAR